MCVAIVLVVVHVFTQQSDQSPYEDATSLLASAYDPYIVRHVPSPLRSSSKSQHRGFAKCNVPPAFAQKVRNALNAEPRSVKLSGLVGTGGLWYGFGRMLLDLWV